jgi:hypothetical protein
MVDVAEASGSSAGVRAFPYVAWRTIAARNGIELVTDTTLLAQMFTEVYPWVIA